MSAAQTVCVELTRQKSVLLRELTETNVLDVLVKKGLISVVDFEKISSARECDKCNFFIEVVSKQNNVRLNELCCVLERECPKLWEAMYDNVDRNRVLTNGERMGQMQSLAGLAAVLSRFSVAPCPKTVRHPTVDPTSGIVQTIKGGLPLYFRERPKLE